MIEETYRIKAIVLKRQAFREHDLLVTVYSLEKGKQQLVARGARKFRSKVAAHVEPFCFIDGMVVRGKVYDYLGSALSESCQVGIKEAEPKISAASRAIRMLDAQTRTGHSDKELFFLLRDFLYLLDKSKDGMNFELISDLFQFRLYAYLGFGMEVYHCIICNKNLTPGENIINFRLGGVVCRECSKSEKGLTISDEAVKVLRLANKLEMSKFKNLKISQFLADEIKLILIELNKQHH